MKFSIPSPEARGGSSIPPALAWTLALCVLGRPADLPGAAVAFEIAPSRAEISECEEVAIEFRIHNPSVLEIAGLQAFLRYPAALFEPVRYEKGDLDGFTVSNGPAPFGAGYPGCTLPASDPWDDGKGMDTVSVISSAYGGEGQDEPLRSSEATLGFFVFRPLHLAAVPADPAVFQLEFESCSSVIQRGNALFDGSGNALDVSYPASLAQVGIHAGVRVPSFSCSADNAGKDASLSWDLPSVAVDGVVIYRDGEKIRALVPSFQRSLVDEDAPAAALVYEVALVLHGVEDSCRVSCVLDLSHPQSPFVRSDANGDERENIADAIAILDYLYRSHSLTCLDAADVDDSGTIDNTDVVRFLQYSFLNGERPELPYPDPGSDPTSDDLDCKGS